MRCLLIALVLSLVFYCTHGVEYEERTYNVSAYESATLFVEVLNPPTADSVIPPDEQLLASLVADGFQLHEALDTTAMRLPAFAPLRINTITDESSRETLEPPEIWKEQLCHVSRAEFSICPPAFSESTEGAGQSGQGSYTLLVRKPTNASVAASMVFNTGVETRTAQLKDGDSIQDTVWCRSMRYYYIDVPEEASTLLVKVTQGGVKCDLTNYHDKSCPWGVLYISQEHCPTKRKFAFRQTFTQSAILPLNRLSVSLSTGRYIIAVAAEMYSAAFDSNHIRNEMFMVPIKPSSVKCCSAPLNYTLSVSFKEETAPLTLTVLLMFAFWIVPAIVMVFLNPIGICARGAARDAVTKVRPKEDGEKDIVALAVMPRADAEAAAAGAGAAVDVEGGDAAAEAGAPAAAAAAAVEGGVVASAEGGEGAAPPEHKIAIVEPPAGSSDVNPDTLLPGLECCLGNCVPQCCRQETEEEAESRMVRSFTMDKLVSQENRTNFVHSSTFWMFLAFIGLFTSVPAWQYTLTWQTDDRYTQNTCHFNNLCRYDVQLFGWFRIDAFNNVLSNLAYLLAGLFLIVHVFLQTRKRRRLIAQGVPLAAPPDPNYFYTLGVAIGCEGIYSGVYHLCPTLSNFQFDTLFMFFCLSASVLALYNRRHGSHIIQPKYYFVLFCIIFLLNSFSVYLLITDVYWIYWLVAAPATIIITLVAATKMYYYKDAGTREVFRKLWENLTTPFAGIHRPFRVLIVVTAVFMNLVLLFVAIGVQMSSPDYFLVLSGLHATTYIIGYMVQKVGWCGPKNYRERLQPYVHVLVLFLLVSLVSAFTLFVRGVTNKAEPIHVSRASNAECILLGFDSHDVWHVVGAIGCLFQFLTIYHLDDDHVAGQSVRVF